MKLGLRMSARRSRIWSVDTIVERDDDVIVRFIHFVSDMRRAPAVRLASVRREDIGYFSHGYSYAYNRDEWRTGPSILEIDPRLFERNRTAEDELNASGREAFGKALALSMTDDEAAAPLEQSGSNAVWARVHVHNVGQGDTIVVELPNDELWLVDACFCTKRRQSEFEQWLARHFRDAS